MACNKLDQQGKVVLREVKMSLKHFEFIVKGRGTVKLNFPNRPKTIIHVEIELFGGRPKLRHFWVSDRKSLDAFKAQLRILRVGIVRNARKCKS